MKRTFRLMRAAPSRLAEELMKALTTTSWFDFKQLFDAVFAALRKTGSANAGEEMLRLRAYDDLQEMVRAGLVEKSAKQYRGNQKSLAAYREHLSARHCEDLLQAVGSAQ
jgi:hypothetical protein